MRVEGWGCTTSARASSEESAAGSDSAAMTPSGSCVRVGGKACLLIRKHDHFTPTRGIKRYVRAPARNHPEGWKLQGHILGFEGSGCWCLDCIFGGRLCLEAGERENRQPEHAFWNTYRKSLSGEAGANLEGGGGAGEDDVDAAGERAELGWDRVPCLAPHHHRVLPAWGVGVRGFRCRVWVGSGALPAPLAIELQLRCKAEEKEGFTGGSRRRGRRRCRG